MRDERELLEDAIREARNRPIAPAHDTDDQTSWGGGVEYAHDGSHSIECYCTQCIVGDDWGL